jgi:hypothetical protein
MAKKFLKEINERTKEMEKLRILIKVDSKLSLYSLKDGSDVPVYVIDVFEEQGRRTERYYVKREFDTKSFNSFIKLFLTDPVYRNSLEKDENFEKESIWMIDYQAENGVSKSCFKSIQRLNKSNPESLKFKDFVKLNTGGLDKFSKMKEQDLIERIRDEDIKAIEKELSASETGRMKALRWVARGLRVDLAIRKVNTDWIAFAGKK